MIVLPEAEDHTIVPSFIWTKHWNVTDRQTDRLTDKRTDSPWLLQRAMQTCRKNVKNVFWHWCNIEECVSAA